ncbi:flightin isoform X2 [Phlebotomus argentipes]|uniref:flightin isoform X2 n=1 Tax=Phlebotomus argentipes TaxID=94469 RepID=UPI00289342DB|nr:flightin isoform X2 [Phlebotomus argentipes]
MAEEDPWAFDEGDLQPEPAAPAPAVGEAGAAEATARPEAEVPQPGDDANYRKPVTLYKHWVRPQFLQYNYMYDYRTNYYDDVIEYLDKKNRGLKPAVPRPQTWAERVLRTHTSKHRPLEIYTPAKKTDSKLIQTLSSTVKGHNYHSRAYISRKYSSIL